MSWNWQQKNWPEFVYDEESFKEAELKFIENAGVLSGSIQHLDNSEEKALRVELLSNEALKTSEIEGDMLDKDSIQSSIRRQLGMQTDQRKVEPAEQGIAEMTIDLYQSYDTPLDKHRLCQWHSMITQGRTDLQDIGRYRTHDDPMQIVSGPLARPTIHFEAPPSKVVPFEMTRFIDWFNRSNKGQEKELSPIVRAAVAHLYFECIHPFEDGNGRVGRAISEKSLSQSLGRPTLISLSHTIQNDKNSYYEALQKNNKELDINDWITQFSNLILKAQEYTLATISFIIEKGKFYKRFEHQLNQRQAKVVERIFREGITGFKGGLSSKNYQSISGAPSATATRDLIGLVAMGAFTKTGALKGTRYYLNIRSIPLG